MTKELEQENESATNSSLSMDDLTSGEVLPEVQENAIAAVQASIAETQQASENLEDAPYGRKADGTPKKKRGRKAGENAPKKSSATSTQTPFNFGDEQTPAPIDAVIGELKKDSTKAATFASGLIEGFTMATISKAWKLEKDERERNVIAWRDAFDHYGGVDLSPPLALVTDHLMIIQKRALADSDTKSRIQLGFAWIKTKFKRRKVDERTPEEHEGL